MAENKYRKPGDKQTSEGHQLSEKVININRTAKVTKGGKKMSFSALVVVGDGNGSVGYAIGKAHEVPDAIKKGVNLARKTMFKVRMKSTTIPHQITGRYGAGIVLLKPASQGTGVIAGNAVRAICDAAGIKDILSKSLGSDNVVNVVKACISGLEKLKADREEMPAEAEETRAEVNETV